MAFVKLDCAILNSTIWYDRAARELFITALLMAEPVELIKPSPQIEVDSLELTGWIVPPGWYGMVYAAGVGIIHKSGMELDIGIEALKRLGSPESHSRTPDYDGRRLVRVDGGYIVLNFIRYRERDYTAAERSKRYREKLRRSVHKSHRDTPVALRNVTQAEAEAEAEVQAEVEEQIEAKEEASLNVYHKDSRTVLFYLNEKTGRHYRETDTNLGFISKRLSEPDVDLAGVQKMIDRQVANWGGTEYAEYLRPETLFNKTKFDGYYAAKDCKPVDRKAGQHGAANRNLHMCGDDEEYREAGRKL